MAVFYDGQVITNQFAYAAIGNWIINKIKQTSLIPFVNNQTYILNHIIAISIAGVSALGINYSYSYTPDGVLAITLTGLTFVGVSTALWQWFISYVMQQGVYNVMKTKEENIK